MDYEFININNFILKIIKNILTIIKNMNKICNIDNDCNENTLCSFDEKKMDNYCIDNSINSLYYGYMNENN